MEITDIQPVQIEITPNENQNGNSTSEASKEQTIGEQIQQEIGITLEDLVLPQNTIIKIIKEKFPKNIKLQTEAKAAITRSSTVFINHLAAVAQEYTVKNNRKYITVTDILKALEVLEFDQFSDFVQNSSTDYKNLMQERKSKKVSSTTNPEDQANGDDLEEDLEDDAMTLSNPNTPSHTK